MPWIIALFWMSMDKKKKSFFFSASWWCKHNNTKFYNLIFKASLYSFLLLLCFSCHSLKLNEFGKKILCDFVKHWIGGISQQGSFYVLFCLFVCLRASLIVSAEFLERGFFLVMLCSLCWLCSNRTRSRRGPTLSSGF